MKTKILVAVVAFLMSQSLSARQAVCDSIVADFDTFIKIVENTHPDPYSGHGGRVAFHIRANEMRNILKNTDNPTANDLYELCSVFLAKLQDGHSYLEQPQTGDHVNRQDSLVLVKFGCVDNSLVVNAIDKSDGHLLGSRLAGVSSVPVEEVLERVAVYYPCENEAGRYSFLADYFRPQETYRKLTGQPTGKITFELITPRGDSVSYCPKVVPFGDFGTVAKARSPRNNSFPSDNMAWREVDGNMVLCLSTVLARENFEFQYKNGWDYYSQLSYYYRVTGKEMPADTIEAIKSVPELSEVFLDMLTEMKSKKIENLIIDLRGNGGGWTPVVMPSLYMIFGDDFIKTDLGSRFYRRLSDLYLKKINMSLDSFNEDSGTDYEIGDYIMPDEDKGQNPIAIELKRSWFVDHAMCSDSVREKLRHLDGRPFYRPENVYVVTDCKTFSAAFHYAFYLSQMGAVVVGEPSSQAPNCFMEVTPFTLPFTGLVGSVSNSLQTFLPYDDPRAKLFTPDIRISYDDYRRYGFDDNAILIYLTDLIKAKTDCRQ